MEIIPAIDLINGQCVRLSAGDFNRQTTYDADPVAVAQRFADAGLRRLHLVDLDGARAGHPVNLAVLEAIARHTSLDIDAGGGIQTAGALAQVLNAGAAHATAGSLAVREPTTVQAWLTQYGADTIYLGADFKGEHILINAWIDKSPWTLTDFIEAYLSAGASTVCCKVLPRLLINGWCRNTPQRASSPAAALPLWPTSRLWPKPVCMALSSAKPFTKAPLPFPIYNASSKPIARVGAPTGPLVVYKIREPKVSGAKSVSNRIIRGQEKTYSLPRCSRWPYRKGHPV